jgi:hypothetical protein
MSQNATQIKQNDMTEVRSELIAQDETIMAKIYIIRGQKVMLDRDLAKLYEVETKVLKQAVKRNMERFPADFTFELTKDEDLTSRSQSALITQVSN